MIYALDDLLVDIVIDTFHLPAPARIADVLDTSHIVAATSSGSVSSQILLRSALARVIRLLSVLRLASLDECQSR
jgi:hypothetical protein